MPVNIEIQNLQTTILINRVRIKADLNKVLKQLKLDDGHLAYVFVDDDKIRTINNRFLRHDYATDVLSFNWNKNKKSKSLNGEIIISLQTAKRNARQYGVSFIDEVRLYLIHGILHLLGYDDHTPLGIKKMRKKEGQLMGLLRLRMASLQ